MTAAHVSAQIALGKFYLHRWEGQVLVDWATSMIDQGFDAPVFVTLAKMEGAERAEQLDQFIDTCRSAGIVVYENMELAIRAYIEDLRRRALAGEIELAAAFAQIRPLAYDNSSILIPGLTELDEDLNLHDSGEKPFHHKALTAENRDEHLRTFFEELRIERGPWDDPTPATDDPIAVNQFDQEAYRAVEIVAIIVIFILSLIYLIAMVNSFFF